MLIPVSVSEDSQAAAMVLGCTGQPLLALTAQSRLGMLRAVSHSEK